MKVKIPQAAADKGSVMTVEHIRTSSNRIRLAAAQSPICRLLALLASVLFASASAPAQHNDCADRHPTSDAWWTGPLLANTAATMPRGHIQVESYLYDNTVQGSFDAHGIRHRAPHENGYGTLSYVVYSVSDKISGGVWPAAGYNQVSNGTGSSSVGLGDWTLQAQKRFTTFDPCTRMPTVSLAVQQTLPTGRYDQLGDHTAAGLGAGGYSTNLALFTQAWFWMPNRRIVRLRVDLNDANSSSAKVRDASVYGTANGFRGTAHPGSIFCLDASLEYSLTRRIALATDLIYHAAGNTHVTGFAPNPAGGSTPVIMDTGASHSWGYAPAVEYSWKRNIGVVVGARVIAAGTNTGATIMPAIGLNFVH